nr:hypothetical protein [Tanacetum cinerariifolium]
LEFGGLANSAPGVCYCLHPMKNKGCASWDLGKRTWGGRGTVHVGQVYDRDQEKHVDVDSFMDAYYAKGLRQGWVDTRIYNMGAVVVDCLGLREQWWSKVTTVEIDGMVIGGALVMGRIAEIDVAEYLFLIDETAQDQGRINDQDMFEVHDLDGDEVFVDVTTGEKVEHGKTVAESVEGITAATTLQITKDELTLAQTLIEIRAAKHKDKGVTIQEPSNFRTTSPSQPLQAKAKGKRIMVEPEKPLKKKDQVALDEEVARKL